MNQTCITYFINLIITAQKKKKPSILIQQNYINKTILGMLDVFYRYGYISSYRFDKNQNVTVLLKYLNDQPAINSIKQISKSSRRFYSKASQLYCSSLGIYIVSTPKGIYSSFDAIKNNLGGEVLCYLY